MKYFCYACKAEMPAKVCGGPGNDRFTEFDNALWIKFNGGYGQFVEVDHYQDWPPEYDLFRQNEDGSWHCGEGIRICHDCAHQLCEAVPWIGKLINPYNSHAHTLEYVQNHPDHFGWDYDKHWRLQ